MLGIFNLGGGEIILILALVLIMFGAKKLPELARGLGTSIKEFKKATSGITDEITSSVHTPLPPSRPRTSADFTPYVPKAEPQVATVQPAPVMQAETPSSAV